MKKIIILYITLLLVLFLSYTCNAQDTTITTIPYPCDSVVTTTIPERIIQIGTVDSTILDTSYITYSVYKTYFQVDGSIVATIPIYDTIPAHDTTYTCHNCATCYRTDTVITPEPTTALYGMFPNEGPETFASRLHRTKQAANNAFRYNFDLYSSGQWNVKQVHDSGLIALTTINSDLVQPPVNNYPVGSELTRRLFSLDSLLTAQHNNLPDVLFIQNEEPNPNYWAGTPQQYMDWLNGCVTIAHKHGVPISNGGLLVNIVYYIRWVYNQEGKTDSANLLTTLGHLPPGVGTAQQQVIDYYKVEVPALAASNIDYINQHWYEPTFFLADNVTAPSGMLPIVIKFLQSRTGKEVVTHEWGTGSDSQALFNATADEWKDNGVNMMIYYDGTDPSGGGNAIAHPEYWKAWILQ